MKYILLPGFSKYNKEWADGLKRDLKKKGIELIVIEWDHWSTGKSNFRMGFESEKVLGAIGDDESIIMAKSVGTRLAATLIAKDKLRPEKLILMGIPSTNDIYVDALQKIDADKVTIIQNTNDPLGSFDKIKSFIDSINPAIKVIEGERSDHSYPYPELLHKLLVSNTK